MTDNQRGILLESGTNELEIVEFTIADSTFGINVIKVKEIIQPAPITKIPRSHPNIEGIIDIRGEVLPVVNVAKALGYPVTEQTEQDKFIVTEFNKTKMVFHVHSVSQIHRISWNQIEKPSDMYNGLESQITGVVKQENGMILLLDFEKIVVDINPASGITKDRLSALGTRERSTKKLMIVEDSPLLRKLIQDTLSEAGYNNLQFFENGKDAFSYLEELKTNKEIKEELQIMITDIEMPQMDGLHLTKKVKDDPQLSVLPIVIFSSLITNDQQHKGKQVGADAQVSKPEIAELVQIIDQLIL
ncbi:two-component system chemotaxis response regulator CheV [Bacillus mesophilus]|uniref:Chemotaxis protein CheV n=1 Tax=Bacillus mesophilus TaxID=1808955 RepID=A0A6M0Q2N9_9BACI|nr:chemotaxis protein [Bacillus mesophilus]MBM7659573.1 two-component system chemotaxis response regulator CheV [Bacillus mesophilus]NEY70444.1 chemotaxis protein CheV [Bacillus mesophilus]